jgi:hypothetical protein
MATVYLARDLRHDRLVALKVLHQELTHALGPERFLREIKVAARLQHPHILPVFDSGTAQSPGSAVESLWFTMPYVAGESLRNRLVREPQLPLRDAVRIALEVADALGYAHGQGLVHRDVKPENILLSGDHCVLADFGVAQALDAAGGERLTETGISVGTPAYMSPEQASAERRLDGRSDIYSLGCVLYEMLAGDPPFTGRTAQAIIARRLSEPVPRLRTLRDVPESVEEVVAKALARSPADRFVDTAQFAQALQTAVGAQPAVPTEPARAGHPAFRRRILLAAAGALVTVGALLGLYRGFGRAPEVKLDRTPRHLQGIPWWLAHRDTASLRRFAARAAEETRRPNPPRIVLRVRLLGAMSTAYAALARGDSARALAHLEAIPDTLCLGGNTNCFHLNLTLARLLVARGDDGRAGALLERWRWAAGAGPWFVLSTLELGRVAERLGEREKAIESYRFVTEAWRRPDPELQPYVSEAREALTRLARPE